MSAFHPVSDISGHADMSAWCQLLTHALQQTSGKGCNDLLDHLVGSGEQRRRQGEAEHQRRLSVDHEL